MRKLVVDTCSLIAFLRYYRFDSANSKAVHTKLTKFLVDKILSDEIMVIDKVFAELQNRTPDIITFKTSIKNKIIDTKALVGQVPAFSAKYYLPAKEQILGNDAIKINLARQQFEESADPYLVLYCKHLKSKSVQVALITEESKKPDHKLHEKIPTMCATEVIKCKDIPYALFDHYKDELNFVLNIIPPVPAQPKF